MVELVDDWLPVEWARRVLAEADNHRPPFTRLQPPLTREEKARYRQEQAEYCRIARSILAEDQWRQGASTEEVKVFDLSDGYWSAARFRAMSVRLLVQQLMLASQRALNPITDTPWLARYTRQLITERRRRRGVA